MWCHRSCNQFVIHDVIAIFVINLIRICASVPNISRDMPMTSHTMTYDVRAHGMSCHRSCNHFVIYDVIVISVIDSIAICAKFCLHSSNMPMTSHTMTYDIIACMIWQHVYEWHHIPSFTMTLLFTMALFSPHDVSSSFQRLSVCSHSFSWSFLTQHWNVFRFLATVELVYP